MLLLRHGERVGVIGPNGAGKSVLLRMILGLENPERGEIIIGPSIRMGYYAQEHETLNPRYDPDRQRAPGEPAFRICSRFLPELIPVSISSGQPEGKRAFGRRAQPAAAGIVSPQRSKFPAAG